MEKNKKTFAERLLDEIELVKDIYDESMINIYRHLLGILVIKNPEGLDHMYDRVNDKFSDAFYSFHKAFRSWDTFDGYYIQTKAPKLSKEQSERRQFLRKKFKREDLPENWVKDKKYADWHKEKYELDLIAYDDGRKSIGGELDSIFWNTIQTDRDGVLYNILHGLMDELKEEENKK